MKNGDTSIGFMRFALDPARGDAPVGLRSFAARTKHRPASSPKGPSAQEDVNAGDMPGQNVQKQDERVVRTNVRRGRIRTSDQKPLRRMALYAEDAVRMPYTQPALQPLHSVAYIEFQPSPELYMNVWPAPLLL